MWNKFSETLPDIGRKIVFVSERGACCYGAYVALFSGKYPDEFKGRDILHAEDGESLHGGWSNDTIWAYLPDDYPIQFMEITDADWY